MYIILDKKLQRIGTLSNKNHGATPFYNDQITQQIADDDQEMSLQSIPDTTNAYDPNGNTKNWGHTLDQIFVPYGYPDTDKIAEGNSLAYKDPNNGRWYVMRLTSVTDATDVSGAHYKQAAGCNLCIWKLGKTVHYAQTLPNANSNKAFSALLEDTGWYVNPEAEPVGGSSTIQFDGTSSSQSLLQQLCQTYGAEIDAYVLFPQAVKEANGQSYASDFQIALKYVDVKRHMGKDTGDRIVYGRNATNIQRTVVDDNLYTRLYVYGQNGSTCACSITNNEPYVEDKVANELYNPATGDNAENFLEGAITSQTMKNPQRLAQWGLKNLKIFNHPRANYTVGVTSKLNAENGVDNNVIMNANIGDTFRVIDYKMNPVLTAESRVIRKQLSFANPTQNQITLGEYTTVNVVPPAFIRNLQEGETNHVNEILDEIRRNPRSLTCTIDKPNGTSWTLKEKTKKFIAHIYVMNEDITSLIQPQGFIWELWQNGQIDNDFTQKHAKDGQVLTLNNDIQALPRQTNQPNNSDNSNNSNNNDNSNNNSNENNNSDNGKIIFTNDMNASDNPSNTYTVNGNNNAPNDDNDDGFDINGTLYGPNDVTGEIRLIIDTQYISDTSDTNFNTDRINHLFTVGKWKDHWGDDRVGALQYVNYNPNDQYYYASLVYYGRQRPRRKHKDNENGPEYGALVYGDKNYGENNLHDPIVEPSSHSEIARLDSNGNYIDSMILTFSHHNSNFGLEYSNDNVPYIWTTIQDYWNPHDVYWVVRIPYQPNKVFTAYDLQHLNDSEKIMSYDENGCFVNYDNSSGVVLFSHDDTSVNPGHEVDFYHAKDLINNHNSAQPFKKIELTDYGFVPKTEDYDMTDAGNNTDDPQDYSTQQTFQSCCLHYPYFFFDSGNENMSDPRMVYCINIQSSTKIFSKELDLSEFNLGAPNNVIGNNPGNYVFAEPETINWTDDSNGNLTFLYGLNVGYQNLKTGDTDFSEEGIPQPDYQHFEQLYTVGFDINQNSPEENSENQPNHSNNGIPDNTTNKGGGAK